MSKPTLISAQEIVTITAALTRHDKEVSEDEVCRALNYFSEGKFRDRLLTLIEDEKIEMWWEADDWYFRKGHGDTE